MTNPFHWWARTRLEIQRGWIAYLTVGLLVGGILVFYFREAEFLSAKGEPIEARIVSMTTTTGNRSRLEGAHVAERAESADGLTGHASVPVAWVKGCKVGDPVASVEVEGKLRIEPRPCR